MRSSKSRQKQNLHVNTQNPWGSNPLPRTRRYPRNVDEKSMSRGFFVVYAYQILPAFAGCFVVRIVVRKSRPQQDFSGVSPGQKVVKNNESGRRLRKTETAA